MRSVICIFMILAAAIVAAAAAQAQEPSGQSAGTVQGSVSAGQVRQIEIQKVRDLQAAQERLIVELKAAQDRLGDVTFFSAASGMLGDVVAGAPYSATTVNESVQTLADGNRIVQRTTYNVSRDGQGRVRREEIGENGAVTSVMILDPVAGASYVLDPAKRTAQKMPLLIDKQAVVMNWREGGWQVVRQGQAAGAATELKPKTTSGAVWAKVVGGPPAEFRRESLGTQDIEGVPADGSRTITTIPAGQIGNERPIDIVSEQWYSKELQMTLSSRQADPRKGETTYRVTNLRRGEPDPTLFQVPGDYTVRQLLEVRQETIK